MPSPRVAAVKPNKNRLNVRNASSNNPENLEPRVAFNRRYVVQFAPISNLEPYPKPPLQHHLKFWRCHLHLRSSSPTPSLALFVLLPSPHSIP